MRVTLIHNPTAGNGRPTRKQILEFLQRQGYDPVYRSAKAPGWDMALDREAGLAIVAGGDGTVEKVGKYLVGRHVPIALLPIGTANNVASSLGVGSFPNVQVSRWQSADARPFDVGTVSASDNREMRFMESVGCGLFAELLRREESENAGPRQSAKPLSSPHGALNGAIGALRAVLDTLEPHPVRLELDGADLSGRYLLVEVMNTPSIGPALRLAPNADPGDGWFDVVLVEEQHADRLESYIHRKQQSQETPPDLPTRRARHVLLDAGQQVVHVDDELWNAGNGGDNPSTVLDVRVEAAALTFLLV